MARDKIVFDQEATDHRRPLTLKMSLDAKCCRCEKKAYKITSCKLMLLLVEAK